MGASNDGFSESYFASYWQDRRFLKQVLDNVHGYIDLDPLALKFIDTEQFQRLTSFAVITKMVYPGAVEAAYRRAQQDPECPVEYFDIKTVKLAGLLHDIGHGPFSQMFEHSFLPQVPNGSTWSHEEMLSVKMKDYVVDKHHIDIDPECLKQAKEMVTASTEHAQSNIRTGKQFLYDIVANGRNGIYVDKFDYLARDTRAACGLGCSFMFQRLMESMRVLGDEISYPANDYLTVYKLFSTRAEMHRTVYTHSKVKGIELAMAKANENLRSETDTVRDDEDATQNPEEEEYEQQRARAEDTVKRTDVQSNFSDISVALTEEVVVSDCNFDMVEVEVDDDPTGNIEVSDLSLGLADHDERHDSFDFASLGLAHGTTVIAIKLDAAVILGGDGYSTTSDQGNVEIIMEDCEKITVPGYVLFGQAGHTYLNMICQQRTAHWMHGPGWTERTNNHTRVLLTYGELKRIAYGFIKIAQKMAKEPDHMARYSGLVGGVDDQHMGHIFCLHDGDKVSEVTGFFHGIGSGTKLAVEELRLVRGNLTVQRGVEIAFRAIFHASLVDAHTGGPIIVRSLGTDGTVTSFRATQPDLFHYFGGSADFVEAKTAVELFRKKRRNRVSGSHMASKTPEQIQAFVDNCRIMGELAAGKHVKYILQVEKDKDSFESAVMEPLRMNGLYWGLTTLDLLGKLDVVDFDEILEWIMKCQHESGGFAGNIGHDPHMLFTLSAIQVLALFDKLDVLDVDKVSNYIAGLQNEDGSFSGDVWGEVDTRFSYIAICSLSIMKRLDRIHVDKAVSYIISCQNVDGGFGCTPGGESLSGQIFCCVAALAITGDLHYVDKDILGWWLSEQQVKSGGLNGRPEKLPDVCYSWWVLSSLTMIDRVHWIDKDKLIKFILNCQDKEKGGISFRPDDAVYIFHTYFGVAGLSLLEYPGVKAIDPAYALPVDIVDRLFFDK